MAVRQRVAMVKCPGCQHENREGAKFCQRCGASMAPRCPSCGSPVEARARYCDECGAALAETPPPESAVPLAETAERVGRKLRGYTPRHLAEKILTSRSALAGERKQVTVLFADVAGFTELSTRVDPEQLHEIMDGCFRHLMEAVHRYEGTVNQFTGDGVMALFGAPIAHENHAVRAVAAALGVQQGLREFGERVRSERGVDFAVRIGLNTGPVVVGKIGDDLRMDYTAQGQTVNLAARLQQAAAPGGVVVGATTLGLVSGYFVTEPLGELVLKGLAAPVPAWRVTGQRSGRGRFDLSIERGLSPLVGRDRELVLLEDLAGRAAGGRGQVVSIVGEAGMGKTRLAYELRRKLGESRFASLRATCAPHGEGLPFEMVGRLLETALRFAESDSQAERVSKADTAVKTLDPALGWTLPYLLHLLGLPAAALDTEGLDPVQRKRRTVEAVRAFFLSSTTVRPLFLLVDDLQWIDEGSEECLRAIVDAVPSHRVLLVCTYRNDYTPSWEGRSKHQRIALEVLRELESSQIVAHVLRRKGVPGQVRALLGRAEGNPLFLEELATFLMQQELVGRVGGGRSKGRGIAEEELPATVRDLLAARIDRLADDLKGTLQLAAVLGREFPLRLLEAIGSPQEGLGDRLAELVRLELLHEKELVPEIRLTFTHAMLQQVAYEGMLVSARNEVHRRAGEALERLYEERLDGVLPELARHYARGEDPERALHFLLRAGDRAASLFVYGDAISWYRQALEVARGCERAEEQAAVVRERIGDAAYASGHIHTALREWTTALATVETRSSDDGAGLHRKIGVALWAAADRDGALAHLQRGLDAVQEERAGAPHRRSDAAIVARVRAGRRALQSGRRLRRRSPRRRGGDRDGSSARPAKPPAGPADPARADLSMPAGGRSQPPQLPRRLEDRRSGRGATAPGAVLRGSRDPGSRARR